MSVSISTYLSNVTTYQNTNISDLGANYFSGGILRNLNLLNNGYTGKLTASECTVDEWALIYSAYFANATPRLNIYGGSVNYLQDAVTASNTGSSIRDVGSNFFSSPGVLRYGTAIQSAAIKKANTNSGSTNGIKATNCTVAQFEAISIAYPLSVGACSIDDFGSSFFTSGTIKTLTYQNRLLSGDSRVRDCTLAQWNSILSSPYSARFNNFCTIKDNASNLRVSFSTISSKIFMIFITGVPVSTDLSYWTNNLDRIGGVTVDVGYTVTMNSANALALYFKFYTANSIIVEDTAELISPNLVWLRTASSVKSFTITGTGTVTLTSAEALESYDKFSPNSIIVSGTAVEIFPDLQAFYEASSVKSINVTGDLTLNAANALAYYSKLSANSIIVEDIYSETLALNLATFNAASSVKNIIITNVLSDSVLDSMSSYFPKTCVTATFQQTLALLNLGIYTPFIIVRDTTFLILSELNTFLENVSVKSIIATSFTASDLGSWVYHEKVTNIIVSGTVTMGSADAILSNLYLKFNTNSIVVRDTMQIISPNLATFYTASSVQSMAITLATTADVPTLMPYASKIASITHDFGTTATTTMTALQADTLMLLYGNNSITVSDTLINLSPNLASYGNANSVRYISATLGAMPTINVPTLIQNLVTHSSKIQTGGITVSPANRTTRVGLTMNVEQAIALRLKFESNTRAFFVVDTMANFNPTRQSGSVTGDLQTLLQSSRLADLTITSGVPTTQDIEYLYADATRVNSVTVDAPVTMTALQAWSLYVKFNSNSIIVKDTWVAFDGKLSTFTASGKINSIVVSDTLANLNNEVLASIRLNSAKSTTVKIGETTAETGADVQTRLTDLISYDDIITSIQLSSSVTLSVVQLSDLNDDISSLGKIIVSDSWSAISGNLSAYSTNTKIIGIVITSGVETEDVPNLVNVSKITSVAVGSGTVTMSVAQATDLLSKIEGTIVVVDTMSAISDSFETLTLASNLSKVTGFTITANRPFVDIRYFINGVSVDAGKLYETDVENLFTIASKVNSVTLLVSKVYMNVEQATALYLKFPDYSIVVEDTFANISGSLETLVAASKVFGIIVNSLSGVLSSVNFTTLETYFSEILTITSESSTMSVAQYEVLSPKTVGSVVVSDTLANLSTEVLLGYSTVSTATLTVKIGETTAETGADVQTRLTDLIAYDDIITSIQLSSEVTLSVLQLLDLNDDILSIGKIIVSDTWTAISGNLSAYITNTKIIGIEVTSGVETEDVPNLVNVSKITGVAVGSGTVAMSVAQATDLLSKIEGTIVVSDTMSEISPKLLVYSTNTKIIGIVITSGVETGDVPNLVNVSKITSVAVGSETVTMSVAQATNLMSKIEGTINVSDTMAAILPKLVAYSTNDKIGNIVITSGQANASDIEILYDNRTKVRDVTVDAPVTMTALQAWSLYVKFNSNSIIVKDLWSAIVGKLSTFTASGKINSIVVSDTLANLNNGVLASILQNSATKSLTVKIGETVAETGAVVQTRLADLITYNSIITSVNTTGPVTMTSAQSAVLQSKFPSGSIISALYTLSGDPTNGSPYLVTSLLCNVSVVDSSGNEQLVIDFTHASKSTTFTQSNNNTIEIDTVLDLSNVSEVMFISATNQVTTRAVVAPASTIQSSAMSLFPVVWGGTQFNFQPISSFLDVLSGEERIQTASELANLYKSRGSFTVYLQQLNTSVYSEVAADLVLKPTTENAVATFKVTPTQMNELFTINDVAKTVTLNSSLESVFGKSWLDSFQITYSDLFPSGTYPVSFPKDNVITDMQKALFHVILPTATLLPTNYTSLLADPGATIQAEYNNGMQLRALVTHYFTTNAAGFHEAIQEAYTNTSTFTAFQKGDVIQWKVTLHVPLEGLGAPPGSSSGTSLSQPFSRVYLFQILVDDANFSSFDVTKYGKLVSEDDTAVGIFNTGNSNSATNKRTYPYQYVNLGNNAYVATDKNSTKYGEGEFTYVSGANVIGDVY